MAGGGHMPGRWHLKQGSQVAAHRCYQGMNLRCQKRASARHKETCFTLSKSLNLLVGARMFFFFNKLCHFTSAAARRCAVKLSYDGDG